MIIYNVVFVGDSFDSAFTPLHDVESYATMQAARDRVATFLRNVGRSGWTVCSPGAVWHCRPSGEYVSIDETEINS